MSPTFRLAIVVPRYGRDVNGGAETLAREYATRLAPHIDVSVLTTCSRDYRTWADHFPAGEEVEDGVRVRRFPVPVPRDEQAFDRFSVEVLTARSPSPEAERRWMDAQGPVSPELEDHLREHGALYDAVLFVPYLYATTVRGLPLVAERAVLVPALHDEPPLRLALFDDIVGSAPSLVFSTPEEMALAERRFGVRAERCHLVGAGIDPPRREDPDAFADAMGIDRPYIVCVGRIDPSKGAKTLIDHHRAYRERCLDGADLVMVGRSVMELPDEPWLHVTGFVDDATKQQALAGALALASASPYESLSLVLLEAWAHGRPVIVTTESDVLVGQTRRAGGGLWFSDTREYESCVDLLLSRPPLAWGLGRAGWRFSHTLDWPHVTERLIDAIPGAREAVGSAGSDQTGDTRGRPLPAGAPTVAASAAQAQAVVRTLGVDTCRQSLMVVSDAPFDDAAVWVHADDPALAERLTGVDIVVNDDGPLAEAARQAGCTLTNVATLESIFEP